MCDAQIRIPGSTHHHKKLGTVVTPRSAVPDPCIIMDFFNAVLHARIRMPGSGGVIKMFEKGSARPDPHSRIRAAS
jgi:hypothetical protein